MVAVEAALQERFGSHAGWAHNTLFISELASHRHLLPPQLQPGGRANSSVSAKAAAAAALAASATADLAPLGRGKRRKAKSLPEPLAGVECGEYGVKSILAMTDSSDSSKQKAVISKAGIRKRKEAAAITPAASALDSGVVDAFTASPVPDHRPASAVLLDPVQEQCSVSAARIPASIEGAAAIGSGLSADGDSAGAGLLLKSEQAPAQRQHFRDWKRRRAGITAAEPGQKDPAAKLVKAEAS